MNAKSLTTKEVARLCRVSDATVKRWEDAGLIQSERTNGGHRRFRADEVARFQKETGLGLKTQCGDESATSAAARRRYTKANFESPFFDAVIRGCETEAANILINQSLQGNSATRIFDEIICPALSVIGNLWFTGEISVTQEHLATRATFNALFKLRNSLPLAASNEKIALCCAFEGDLHELPTYMAQMTLESLGYEVINFGANTPVYSLYEEVSQFAPALICISATVLENLERTSREYKEFRSQISKTQTPIFLGGRVFNEKDLKTRFPAEHYPQTFGQLAELTKKLV